MLDMAIQKSYQERFRTIRMLEKENLCSEKDQLNSSFKELKKNGFFECSSNNYYIKEISSYEETSDDFKTRKGYFLYELVCLCLETGQMMNFEWEYDDELEISATSERIAFRNLTDDSGETIDEDDLEKIANDKDGIVLENEKFWYADDWAAIYKRGDREEKVYMYEFENDSHTKFLTIEEWPGSGKDEYQIYTSTPVQKDSILVISKGEHS